MKSNQRQAETILFDELLILNDNIVDVFAKNISEVLFRHRGVVWRLCVLH